MVKLTPASGNSLLSHLLLRLLSTNASAFVPHAQSALHPPAAGSSNAKASSNAVQAGRALVALIMLLSPSTFGPFCAFVLPEQVTVRVLNANSMLLSHH